MSSVRIAVSVVLVVAVANNCFALLGGKDGEALFSYSDRHPDRIFQWVEDRRVPAENNMSERGVRRTVIARKTCGGSQSEDEVLIDWVRVWQK